MHRVPRPRSTTPLALLVSLAGGLWLSGCALKIESSSPATATPVDVAEPDTRDTASTDVPDTEEADIAPTGECGPSFCKNEGPCHAIAPKKVYARDGSCTWDCGYPATYVVAEGDEHCDLEDNDCDGVTDDVPPRPSDSVTCAKGVCAGAPSRCVAGAWKCDYEGVAAYQAVESTCDKLDNDCDGETDEDVKGTAADCEFVGVCAQVGSVACTNGKLDCGAAKFAAPLFELDELSCDGLDNDCDGQTDEGIGAKPSDLAASTCFKVGVCSVGTKPSCSAGTWSCSYASVVGYEASETSCDNLDNDCDGLTDDNLVELNPTNCDTATKAKAAFGVCKKGAAAICLGGVTSCTYTYLADYEPVETSCDGKDNDCDGQTDEALSAPPAFCTLPGACAQGATAFCDPVTAAWQCDFATIPGYEQTEVTCDGKDNDCDGKVDEGISLPSSQCPESVEGVCKNQPISVTCGPNGTPVCDPSTIAAYQKVETACDGKDNDCDGFTDENITDVAASTCSKLGVCANSTKVIAKCTLGQWSCDYNPLGKDFEAGNETLCDGKDNDCDGTVDEGISGVGVADCNLGVCSGKAAATCIGGVYKCDVAGIVGYENPEASCDGKDNNCDGVTDEGACGTLAPCTANSQCKSGRCRETPDGAESCCVSKDGECPEAACGALALTDQTGCLQADNGGGLQWYTTSCTTNGWNSDPTKDLCTNGACSDGICRECAPGTRVCDGPNAVLPCTDTGSYGTAIPCPPEIPTPTCVQGFPGTCLRHEDQPLKTSSEPAGFDMRNVVPIRTSPSSHFVLWQTLALPVTPPAAPGTTYFVSGRLSDAFGRTSAPYATLVAPPTGGTVIEPRGAKQSDTLSVITWKEVSSSDAGNIRLRVVNHTTGAWLAAAAVFANVSKPFEQSAPQVARATGGQIVSVWQSASVADGTGLDISLHSFTFNGATLTAAVGADKLVNNASTGEQKQPAITALNDGKVAIAFVDSSQDEPVSLGIWARIYDPTITGGGAFVAPEFALHGSPQGDQKDVALATRATGFVAVWTSNHQGDDNVYARVFNDDGTSAGSETLLTKLLSGTPLVGDQGHADVAVADDGSIVVVYDDVAGDVSGGSVQFMQFNDALEPVGAARRVNDNQIVGAQKRPHVAAALDGFGTPWALVTFESEGANGSGLTGAFERPMVLAAHK